ncbi:MAG: LapA family protein [Deferrisomatales bacterium]|nr:LapA family protein [Deferrisomatales bacterium]
MLAFVKKILFALVLAAVVIFGFQTENLEALGATMQFHFKVWDLWDIYTTPKFPVALLFIVFFLLGILTAGFHGIYERLARKVEIRARDKRIRELEKELGALRAEAAALKPPPPADEAVAQIPAPFPAAPQRGEDAPARRPQGAPGSRPSEEEPTL